MKQSTTQKPSVAKVVIVEKLPLELDMMYSPMRQTVVVTEQYLRNAAPPVVL